MALGTLVWPILTISVEEDNVYEVELKDGYTFPEYIADLGGRLGFIHYAALFAIACQMVCQMLKEQIKFVCSTGTNTESDDE